MVEGISATFSIGSISVVDMQVGLTGQEPLLLDLTVNDMTIGLTGQEFTASQGTKQQTKQLYFLVYQSHQHKTAQYFFTRSTINRSII